MSQRCALLPTLSQGCAMGSFRCWPIEHLKGNKHTDLAFKYPSPLFCVFLMPPGETGHHGQHVHGGNAARGGMSVNACVAV